jgi:hypothetical protein
MMAILSISYMDRIHVSLVIFINLEIINGHIL